MAANGGIERAWEFALGWFVPGLGHVVRGERTRGAIYAASVLSFFFLGQWLSQDPVDRNGEPLGGFHPSRFRAVSYREHPVFFWAQLGAGLPTLGFTYYDKMRWKEEDGSSYPTSGGGIDLYLSRYFDTGLLLTGIAGLLNWLVALSLLDPARDPRRRREREGAT